MQEITQKQEREMERTVEREIRRIQMSERVEARRIEAQNAFKAQYPARIRIRPMPLNINRES